MRNKDILFIIYMVICWIYAIIMAVLNNQKLTVFYRLYVFVPLLLILTIENFNTKFSNWLNKEVNDDKQKCDVCKNELKSCHRLGFLYCSNCKKYVEEVVNENDLV